MSSTEARSQSLTPVSPIPEVMNSAAVVIVWSVMHEVHDASNLNWEKSLLSLLLWSLSVARFFGLMKSPSLSSSMLKTSKIMVSSESSTGVLGRE